MGPTRGSSLNSSSETCLIHKVTLGFTRKWDEKSFRKPWIQGTEEPLLRPYLDYLVTGTRCLHLMCYTLASRKFLTDGTKLPERN